MALIARGKDGLQAAAAEVRQHGARALVLPCDVADADAVEDAAEQAEQTLGPIDVWVNDAMVSVFSPIKKMTAEEFKRVTEVTYLGYVYGTLAALHRMLPRDRGTIVQVGSALAFRSIPLQSAYCAAKHAINGFTESLRCELIHDGSQVHVTEVQMPAMNTPQFGWVKSRLPNKAQPVPPIFEPEIAADAIYFAATHRRRSVWVGRSTALAILGNRIAPGLIDHYLGRTGYKSQQTEKPEDADRPDNLWQALDDAGGSDRGAHGDFDPRASSYSPEFTLAKGRIWLERAAVGCIALGAGAAIAHYAVKAMQSDAGNSASQRSPTRRALAALES